MRDAALFGATVLAFAAAITFHVTLVLGLSRHTQKRRAILALVVPPLAPYWGWAEHMRFRSVGWILSVVAYVAARLLQR